MHHGRENDEAGSADKRKPLLHRRDQKESLRRTGGSFTLGQPENRMGKTERDPGKKPGPR